MLGNGRASESVVVEMTGRRSVGAVDTMWLNMDRPNNLMVIDSVMWFDEPVDWARFANVVEKRLLTRYPVFRQRPVGSLAGLGRQHWEDDPEFSLSRHLRRVTLLPPGDEACLQRYVDAQAHRALDRDHPLWELHLVDGYHAGAAIVARFHHAIADGMALAEVLLSLTDATPTADLAELPSGPETPVEAHSSVRDLIRTGLDIPRHLIAASSRAARPSAALDTLTLTRQAGAVASKLLLGSNPTSALSGLPGSEKRSVWSRARPLAEVKWIGRLAGATVNDVLVGAVSGAITDYLLTHGGEARDLTTMVPVNLRPVGEPLPPELGNRFALVLLPLPTGARSPLARLSETKRRMDSIKASPEAAITFGLINAIGRTHPRVEQLLVDFFSGKAIGVTTNVAGPRQVRYVVGTRMAGLLGWVPGSGRQTLGVSIVTYNQKVRVGFKVDAAVVPDPERLLEAFDQEMDDLLRMARAA